MKKSTPIEAELVELYCDECGTEMAFTGLIVPTCPPTYQYQCVKCGRRETRRHEYPRIIWKERKGE